eukprot:1158862-Pelagomonas_calceolata.AAC.6
MDQFSHTRDYPCRPFKPIIPRSQRVEATKRGCPRSRKKAILLKVSSAALLYLVAPPGCLSILSVKGCAQERVA